MKRYLLLLLSYFPRNLPVGLTEFDAFTARVILQAGKFADYDSMKWALASQVIHLGPQASAKPDQYFIRSLRKAAANQVASQVFQDVKAKQQEEAAARAAQTQAEATAPTPEAVPSDEKQVQKDR